jgi:hypothetical protein
VRPRERIRRLVERHREPPRPVPWWPLIRSVFGLGFGVGVALVTVVLAAAADVLGLAPLGPVLAVGLAVAAVGALVDLGRLLRLRRRARDGVMVTATATDDPGERTRLGRQRRRRTVPHPSGTVHDRVRVPGGAPTEAFEQSVLVAPDRAAVRLTLHPEAVLPDPAEEAARRPSGEALAGWPPLVAATGWGRLGAAWRIGMPALLVSFVAAALAVGGAGPRG